MQTMKVPNSCWERRQNLRFPITLPLDFSETLGVQKGALVTDISEVGLRIRSVHSIQIGTELKIRVYVSKDQYSFDCIEGNGKIIWKTLYQESGWRGFRYGLCFTDMASEDREKLAQLIMIQQEGS